MAVGWALFSAGFELCRIRHIASGTAASKLKLNCKASPHDSRSNLDLLVAAVKSSVKVKAESVRGGVASRGRAGWNFRGLRSANVSGTSRGQGRQ